MIPFDAQNLAAWAAAVWWPLVRTLALFNSAPVFSSPEVPRRVRIGLALFIAILIQPLIPTGSVAALGSWGGFLVVTMQQILVGLLLGIGARVAFAAVNFAGAVIGLEMGLGFATLFDPQYGVKVPTLSSFLGLLGALIFLSVNGHLILIAVLAKSFSVAPPGIEWHFGAQTWYQVTQWGGELFLLGLVMALPVLTILFLANIALGILSKIAPQLNIFVVGFPVLLLLGLGGLYFAAPMIGRLMLNAFELSLRFTGGLVGMR